MNLKVRRIWINKIMLKSFLTILCTIGMAFSIYLIEKEEPKEQEKLVLIVNMDNERALPRNFRMTEEPYINEEIFPNFTTFLLPFFPSSHGLSKLRASASGQFSQQSLAKILETIPSEKILLIDLREESHGFVNGIAVSWYSERDWSNKDKSLKEIVSDEKQRLEKALEDHTIQLYQKNNNINNPLVVEVKEAYTEADLAQNMKVQYERIPVTDHLRPSDDCVDQFVALIKPRISNSGLSDDWIHFHCSAGRGRSTTFIAMYDMMCNASHVSFDDIIARQAMIGGKDLAQPFDTTDWRYSHHFDRLQFLVDFYNYCRENPNFEQSWSSWIKL